MAKSIVRVPRDKKADYDYIAFSFKGKHSYEDFGIIRVSDGDRYNIDLTPTLQDKTAEVPGGDGMYYFGTHHKQREFHINFAFDKMTEEKMRELRKWLDGKEMGDLWFAEEPYKVYTAKPTNVATIKTLAFEEQYTEGRTKKTRRIYKGEGSITFTAYWPYAHTPDIIEKWDEKKKEWQKIGSGLDAASYTEFASYKDWESLLPVGTKGSGYGGDLPYYFTADLGDILQATDNLTFTKQKDENFISISGLKEDCQDDSTVIIPEIGDYGGVAFPIKKILGGAFENKYQLETIEIPEHITDIESEAFKECDILVIYAESEGKPDNWETDWVADDIPVIWDAGNNNQTDGYVYLIRDGMRYRLKDKYAFLDGVSRTKKSVTIPKEIQVDSQTYNVRIMPRVLKTENSQLVSLTIPELKHFNSYGNYVKCSLNGLFDNADNARNQLQKVTIELQNNGNVELLSTAFEGWSSLLELHLPTAKGISSGSFKNCQSLTIYTDNVDGASSGWNDTKLDHNPKQCPVISSSDKENYKFVEGVRYFIKNSKAAQVATQPLNSKATYILPEVEGAIVSTIEEYAFYGCDIKEISISNSITTIGSYAFKDCRNLTEVQVSDEIAYIGKGAFEGTGVVKENDETVQYLTSKDGTPYVLLKDPQTEGILTIPNTIKVIYTGALNQEVLDIIMPSDIRSICSGAFGDSGSDLNIYYKGETKEDWDEINIDSESNGRLNKSRIYYQNTDPTTNGYYWFTKKDKPDEPIILDFTTNRDGLKGCSIKQYVGMKENVVIPDMLLKGDDLLSVVRIDENAFDQDKSPNLITSISIPSIIVEIGENALQKCVALNQIIVDDSNSNYMSIDNCCLVQKGIIHRNGGSCDHNTLIRYAPKNDDTEVTFGNDGSDGKTVHELGAYAFSDCKYLKTINIGYRITKVSTTSFYNCTALEDINLTWNYSYSGANGILYTNDMHSIVKYPAGKKDNTIIDAAFLVGVNEIYDYAFEHQQHITSARLTPITTLGYKAFYACKELKTVELSDAITIIRSSAFANCEKLQWVIIGSWVTEIEPSPFSGCTSLAHIFYKGTKDEWEMVNKNGQDWGNTVYFYSESRPSEGRNYWHYDQYGEPAVWY